MPGTENRSSVATAAKGAPSGVAASTSGADVGVSHIITEVKGVKQPAASGQFCSRSWMLAAEERTGEESRVVARIEKDQDEKQAEHEEETGIWKQKEGE